MNLPTLDSHAHLNTLHCPDKLAHSGAVLAMSLSLEEAEHSLQRNDPLIAWGVGCHPRFPRAQESFDADRFRFLAGQMAVVGEVGMDTGSRVPLETQRKNFQRVLEVIADLPRPVSIHSYQATGLVLNELERNPISIPILHWWTGNVAETKKAVALGCYFSIHSAVARHSKFRLHVPLERILVESDHGYNDPPAAIPCRIEWVEYLAAQQFGTKKEDIRKLAWNNLARIIRETNINSMVPKELSTICKQAE